MLSRAFAKNLYIRHMKKPVQITMPEPCPVKKELLTPVDGGWFCGGCQKKVHDYTNYTDEQLARIYKNKEGYCGMFFDSQINRPLILPKRKKNLSFAATGAVMSLFTLGSINLYSQEKPAKTEKIVSYENDESEFIVSGTVRDKQKNLLEGAKITLKGKNIKVLTDHNGNFALMVRKGDILTIKYRGKKKKEILIQGYKDLNVYLLTRREEKELPRRIGRYF